MKTITVARCLTNPGFIAKGKTYHLISDDKGLYVIYLGKWLSGYANNATALEGLVLSGQDKKNAAIHESVLQEIAQKGSDKVVDNKNSFLITKADIIAVELKNIDYAPSLKIKSKKVKIHLRFWSNENKENLKEIYSRLS